MKLDGFGIFVKDMKTMVAFYRDVLGFEIEWQEGESNVYMVKDGTVFMLYGRKEFEKMTHRKYQYLEGLNNQSTGGTNSIATPTGYLTSNNRMKYRGIEDFSGNDAVWMPDVTGAYYTSRDVETYKSGTVNKTQLSYYRNITASQSWRNIQALGWDEYNPFICLPSKLGSASSTTYFGTNMYGPNGNNDYLSRNKLYFGYTTNANLLTSVFDYTYSSATDTTTSRLIKYEI